MKTALCNILVKKINTQEKYQGTWPRSGMFVGRRVSLVSDHQAQTDQSCCPRYPWHYLTVPHVTHHVIHNPALLQPPPIHPTATRQQPRHSPVGH